MVFGGYEPVLIEQHKTCGCGCAVQAKDCNAFQTYDKSQCKCQCTNLDDQRKCLQVK